MTPGVAPVVWGYHGTTRSAIPDILQNGFRISRNGYDWLGNGIYFFLDAPRRARTWAVDHHGDEAAVVAARMTLRDTIDLLDLGWWDTLKFAYKEYRTRQTALPRQTRGAHRIDREVLNYCVDLLQENNFAVRAIRGVFVEGEPLFEHSGLWELAHVQIAVRDSSIIHEIVEI